MLYYSAPARKDYCDERVVCLSVSVYEHLRKCTSDLRRNTQKTGSLLAALRYVMYFRFMDDVIHDDNEQE